MIASIESIAKIIQSEHSTRPGNFGLPPWIYEHSQSADKQIGTLHGFECGRFLKITKIEVPNYVEIGIGNLADRNFRTSYAGRLQQSGYRFNN